MYDPFCADMINASACVSQCGAYVKDSIGGYIIITLIMLGLYIIMHDYEFKYHVVVKRILLYGSFFILAASIAEVILL